MSDPVRTHTDHDETDQRSDESTGHRTSSVRLAVTPHDERASAWRIVVRTLARSGVAFGALTASLLVIGWIGRRLVFDSAIGEAEASLVSSLADNRVGSIDTAMTIGSALTDTWTVIGVLFGSVAVLLATGNGRFAGVMLVAVALEVATFAVVGQVIDRSRPDVDVLHSIPSTPSFPSGHVAAAIALYGSLALVARSLPTNRVPRTIWVAVAIAVLAVGSSRVYEGVHYPTDVLGGLLLGIGALYAAVFAARSFAPHAAAPPVPSTSRTLRRTSESRG